MARDAVTLATRVKVPNEVIHRRVGEETVLLHLDEGFYYGLDPIGSRIWELLAVDGSLLTAVETLVEEYEVDREELQQDILRLVSELRAKGLVEVSA